MCARLLNSPKTLRSHKTTAMTTTPFKMDLIVACIGKNRLTSHSKTPTTISTINMLINGIVPPYLAHSARLTENVVCLTKVRYTAKQGGAPQQYWIGSANPCPAESTNRVSSREWAIATLMKL